MNARRVDSIWLIGGISLMAAMIIASWFIVIKPKYADADSEREQAGTITVQVSSLNSKYSEQKKRAEDLDEYMADLATYQEALPQVSNTNEIPAFLRRLQTLGTDLSVRVNAYTAADPATSTDAGTVTELPININATGTVTNLTKFIKQLQTTQPRALLIESAAMTRGSGRTATLQVSMNAFITASETADLEELKKSLDDDSTDS
ncbi:putative type IV pilus biogenesis protein PilO [Actinoplanes missouriensis 431]|uniref:Putative type IV pilus biogenesis protein PilO n=1 Tax=Actinoplanes missouriensis (strain ATCC 14538 / DSM 43046 / CBS 188.64 / JCM 3121 / NBRC 102363 / NCIMB 12654 / NRRL B-3342 / UNCC 431) TaxID=512565 RepID=I0GZD2_ACTM4|nr:type 4a pilus biogenesis protein PilO [Actinoplanes missouriensis]BAL86119.1 putative type IV pilus biogenesis protein PilO [Actinoplanes missouriensis 431]